MADHRGVGCFPGVLVYRLSSPGLLGGLALLPASLVEVFYTVTQIPKKPTHSSLFLALAGPFVFWGIWKKTEIRIEQRAVEWVFGIWGFLLGVLLRRPGAWCGSRR